MKPHVIVGSPCMKAWYKGYQLSTRTLATQIGKQRTWKELHPCSSISLHPFPCQQMFTQRHDTHTHQEIDGCPSLPRLNEVFSEGEGSVFDENFPTLYGRNRRIERMEDLVHLWRSRSWHIDTCTKVNFDDISSYPSSRMNFIYMLLPTWVRPRKPTKKGPST